MQNGANFAANNSNSDRIEATNNSAGATNNKTTALQPSFTGNECKTRIELDKASLNTFSGRRDFATRYNNSSLLKGTCNSSNNNNTKNYTFQVEQKQKDNFDEKFVVHHVISKDSFRACCCCCCCCCYYYYIALKNNNKKNKLKNKQENPFYLVGVNSRCNCSGQRRSTLSGLIESFEQKLQLEEPIDLKNNDPSSKPLSARERLSRHKTEKRLIKRQRVNVCCNKILRQSSKRSKMRDIITPVKYQATTSSDTTSNTESDSIEFEYVQKQNIAHKRSHDDQQDTKQTQRNNKSLHHVATKGVPVLPKPSLQKLTKTRWQPPTDGRQYEQRYATPSLHLPLSSTNSYLRSSASPQKIANGNEALEDDADDNDTSDSTSRSLTQDADIDIGQTREAAENKNSKQIVSKSISATLAATRGPQIVKHQISSSRRLLNQLARLRRLNEPLYRVRRPEKVEEVEKLIERLERATREWEEDEHLLDRTELRDWPLEYHKRFPHENRQHQQQEETEGNLFNNRLSDNSTQRDDTVDFGCRLDVNPFEQDTIDRSHYNHNMIAATNFLQAGSYSANSTLTTDRTPRRSRAFADRYMDDLAVRRLNCAKSLSPHSNCTPSQYINQPQMSYLLCSNAYTPSIDTNIQSAYETLDLRVRNDDLHYRNVKSKPESHEPPFGIPRQLAVAASHSSASHYLRRHESAKTPPSPTTTNNYSCLYNMNNNGECNKQTSTKRLDSKVSFNEIVDRASGSASVDSGVAASSPYSTGRQSSSATLRLTPVSSPPVGVDNSQARSPHQETPTEQYVYEDDVTQEVDLDEELAKSVCQESNQPKIDLEHNPSICESPVLERYKTEIKAIPIRRRPKINIENPRAKSPLLRISYKEMKEQSGQSTSKNNSNERKLKFEIQCYEDRRKRSSSRSISELECNYDFTDEDENDDNDQEEKREKLSPTLLISR